jgi:hypothetical protein
MAFKKVMLAPGTFFFHYRRYRISNNEANERFYFFREIVKTPYRILSG